MIDVFIKIVLVINDSNKIVRMFRNCRLRKLIELDFSHVFYVENDDNFAKLIIRKFKVEHKLFEFKKIIFAFVVVIIVATNILTFSILTRTIKIQFIKVNATFNIIFIFSILNCLKKSFANLFVELKKSFSNFFVNSFIFDELIMFNEITIY